MGVENTIEKIESLINAEKWMEAMEELLMLSSKTFDDHIALLLATVNFHFGNREQAFEFVSKGLEYNYKNYELYLFLGDYYYNENVDMTYLCYENAKYYCDNEDDKKIIEEMMGELINNNDISVRKVTFVILSYNNKQMTIECINSIRETNMPETYDIVVVDNASTDGIVEWLENQSDIKLIKNDVNQGFPKGCNQGMLAAEKDTDIFLLNNDTIVMPNAIFYLRMGLYSSENVGATGAITNHAGNYQMIDEKFNTIKDCLDYAKKTNIPKRNPYEKKCFLIGFALMVKRNVLEKIGLLDEVFSPGNFEDTDWGMRIQLAGYTNLLCYNSFIYHYGSAAFSKDEKKYSNLLQNNKNKFIDKYGFDIDYYKYCRKEIIRCINESREQPIKVLEVGCGLGATLANIQYLYPNAEVHGIELVKEIVDIAKNSQDIICGDIEQMTIPFEEGSFDYIILGDVIEHLRNPWGVLNNLKEYLKVGGYFLCSIPNLMHYSVITELLKGNFTYKDSGILDRTHLRFFTLNEIVQMFQFDCEMKIENVDIITMGDGSDNEDYKQLISMEGIADKIQFLTYQYIVKVKK